TVTPLANEQKFYQACEELCRACELNTDAPLNKAGRRVLDSAYKAFKEKLIKSEELPSLTEFVNNTAKIIQTPPDHKTFNNYSNSVNQALSISVDREWGKLIGGAMLSVLGIALVGTAVAVAVATFGGSAPLSALAIAVGGNLAIAGFTVSAAVVTGVTLGSAAI